MKLKFEILKTLSYLAFIRRLSGNLLTRETLLALEGSHAERIYFLRLKFKILFGKALWGTHHEQHTK